MYKKYNFAHKGQRKKHKATYYITHKEKILARVKIDTLKRKYGITLAEYDQMLEEQHGVCAICGGADPSGRRLAVDHDHETGKVRGLLCTSCNTRLGFLEIHRAAIRQYLSRASKL